MVALNTNYRCHQDIVSLARTLFYSPDLQSCANISDVVDPIWFVCSSLERKLKSAVETDSDEAKALIEQLKTFSNDSIREEDDVCVLATNRNQVKRQHSSCIAACIL